VYNVLCEHVFLIVFSRYVEVELLAPGLLFLNFDL
jgi:hypothetical protein